MQIITGRRNRLQFTLSFRVICKGLKLEFVVFDYEQTTEYWYIFPFHFRQLNVCDELLRYLYGQLWNADDFSDIRELHHIFHFSIRSVKTRDVPSKPAFISGFQNHDLSFIVARNKLPTLDIRWCCTETGVPKRTNGRHCVHVNGTKQPLELTCVQGSLLCVQTVNLTCQRRTWFDRCTESTNPSRRHIHDKKWPTRRNN